MNLFRAIMVIGVLVLVGCSKSDSNKSDCTASMLIENDMVEYTGQEIGCKFFLELYTHKKKQFFLLGNYCADMISYPIDCEGNQLCENGQDLECKDFYTHSKRVGIIGIGR